MGGQPSFEENESFFLKKTLQGIDELANLLLDQSKTVVFFTDEVLTLATGFPPFGNSEFSSKQYKELYERYGTVEKFYNDPLGWWNKFWFPIYGQLEVKPSLAHLALGYLAQNFDNVEVVTSCIYGILPAAGVPKNRLRELNGRVGTYTCTGSCGVNSLVENDIVYSKERSSGSITFPIKCKACDSLVLPTTFFEYEERTIKQKLRKFELNTEICSGAAFIGISRNSKLFKALFTELYVNIPLFVFEDGVRLSDFPTWVDKKTEFIDLDIVNTIPVFANTMERLCEIEGKPISSWSEFIKRHQTSPKSNLGFNSVWTKDVNPLLRPSITEADSFKKVINQERGRVNFEIEELDSTNGPLKSKSLRTENKIQVSRKQEKRSGKSSSPRKKASPLKRSLKGRKKFARDSSTKFTKKQKGSSSISVLTQVLEAEQPQEKRKAKRKRNSERITLPEPKDANEEAADILASLSSI